MTKGTQAEGPTFCPLCQSHVPVGKGHACSTISKEIKFHTVPPLVELANVSPNEAAYILKLQNLLVFAIIALKGTVELIETTGWLALSLNDRRKLDVARETIRVYEKEKKRKK